MAPASSPPCGQQGARGGRRRGLWRRGLWRRGGAGSDPRAPPVHGGDPPQSCKPQACRGPAPTGCDIQSDWEAPCQEWPVTSTRPRSGTWGQEGKTHPSRSSPWSSPVSSQKIPSECRREPAPGLGLGVLQTAGQLWVPSPEWGSSPLRHHAAPTPAPGRAGQHEPWACSTLWDTAMVNFCLPRKPPRGRGGGRPGTKLGPSATVPPAPRSLPALTACRSGLPTS